MKEKLHFTAARLLPVIGLLAGAADAQLEYPRAPRGEVVDLYHGEEVSDPYRWLEEQESETTRSWIEAQQDLLAGFLGDAGDRQALGERILAIGRYDRRSSPRQKGERVFHTETRAGETYPRLFVQEGEGEPRLLLDPARDLEAEERYGSYGPSPEGGRCAIRVQVGDAPFQEMRVLDVESGRLLADRVRNSWAGASWLPDESGFFYARFPEREGEHSLEALGSPTIWMHRVGTTQDEDVLVYEREEDGGEPWLIRKLVTYDGRFLLLNCARGSDFSGLDDEILFLDLREGGELRTLVADAEDGRWVYVDHRGDDVFFRSTSGAPRGRILRKRFSDPAAPASLVVPESEHHLATVSAHPDRLGLGYLVDARTQFRFVDHSGEQLFDLRLPGNVSGLPNDRERPVVHYSSSLLFDPGSLYAFDVRTGESELFWRPELRHDPEGFAIRQLFYRSLDGTRVPMWVAGRRDVLARREPAPLFLYAYGALGWAAFPWYQPHIVAWMERGGLYALPGVRGGGEYGDAWWEAGRRQNRQKAIDDILAASEFLCQSGHTSPDRLVVNGASASGVLAAAAAMQRPELFAAALIEVPKLDMLRHHLFTGSAFSVGDSGTAEDPDDYAILRSYSPLHNVRPGIDYPAFLVTVGEDDGVCPPLHGTKFIAELQARSTSPHPALLLFMEDTGHGWGRTPETTATHQATALTFLERVLDTFGATAPPVRGGR